MRKALRAAAIAVLVLSAGVPVEAGTVRTIPGRAVFVNANRPSGNEIVVLHRTPSGKLLRLASVPTGGRGSGVGERNPPDPLGAQGGLVLTDDGRWLLAVNAGSDQISAFRVVGGIPRRTDVVASGGDYPLSIAARGDRVFVLNGAGRPSIVGFRLSARGQLLRTPGSTRRLATVTPAIRRQPDIANGPSQLAFSPDGNFLVVTDKNLDARPGTIEVFRVLADGSLSAGSTITPSSDATPFGFTFDRKGHLIVTEAALGVLATYDIRADGSLELLSRVPTNRCDGFACSEPCWVDLSRSFAFTSNTSSNDIASFRIGLDGRATLVETVAATTARNPLDLSVSGDGRWLHVLSGTDGVVEVFFVEPITGSLTRTDRIQLFEPLAGPAGLAAE